MIKQKIKGFTLIEVLVILSIITIMTISVFSNYGKNNEVFALERSSQKIAQDIRRAQEMATSGLESASSILGYGVYFSTSNPTSYLIYEEVNDASPIMSYETGDITKETINLENGVEILSLVDSVSVSNISISFEPPNPLTYIDGDFSDKTAIITLCVASDHTKTRTITINSAGMVQVTK